MSDFSKNFEVFSRALDIRTQRHQVLASNIANADTPNYKARDFDFQGAMQNALAGRLGGSLGLSRTAGGHLAGGAGDVSGTLQYRTTMQAAVDGNTVDMDVERAHMAENATQYQILTQLIGDKFRGLKSAMAGTQS